MDFTTKWKKPCHSGAPPQAESPEPIFQRPVFIGSGPRAAGPRGPPRGSLRSAPGMTIVFARSPLRERCQMPTQSLPAASLRPADRLPAARVLLRVSNYLIHLGLWVIGAAIFGVPSWFLPALREAAGRVSRSIEETRRPEIGELRPSPPTYDLVGRC